MCVWTSEGRSVCEFGLDLVLFPSAPSFALLNRRTTEQRDSILNVLLNLPSSSVCLFVAMSALSAEF